MNYAEIYNQVDDLMSSRDGLNNPKQKKSYDVFVRELTGLLCGVAYQNNIHQAQVLQFIKMVRHSTIGSFIDDGRSHPVCNLIDPDIVSSSVYQVAEFALMNYKPGKTQVGPGELFFCLFDRDSTFGIDNQSGYDIQVNGITMELKKYGTNLTTPELFDKYHASDKVQQLLVVQPVSDATTPRVRSRYSCITFDKTPWRDIYKHKGSGGSLVFI
jgi:hypothetical protein|tara:strand:+ start:325 stop:966 length:642 start_codon:yes stop_codon:yes gene_type:complete